MKKFTIGIAFEVEAPSAKVAEKMSAAALGQVLSRFEIVEIIEAPGAPGDNGGEERRHPDGPSIFDDPAYKLIQDRQTEEAERALVLRERIAIALEALVEMVSDIRGISEAMVRKQ